MKKNEVIFITLLAGGFIIPPAIAEQWMLLLTFVTFFAIFGIYEWISVKTSSKTISKKMWDLRKTEPVKFWVILGGMIIAWAALIWHFLA